MVKDTSKLQQFLVDSLQAQKLPVFLYTSQSPPFLAIFCILASCRHQTLINAPVEKEGVPEIAVKLAMWLQDTYVVHVFPNPPQDALAELGELQAAPSTVSTSPSACPSSLRVCPARRLDPLSRSHDDGV